MEPKQPPQQPTRRITPRALLETKTLRDLQIHPDGHRIALVVTENDFEESRSVSHIWLTEYVAPQESETAEETPKEPDDWTRQLTYSYEGEKSPRWSPDGETLAFLSNRPDPTEDEDETDSAISQIWLLPLEGGEARKRTSAPESILDYVWMPDSDALLYLTPEPRPKPLASRRKEEEEHLFIDPTLEHEEPLRRQLWSIGTEHEKPELLCTLPRGADEFALSPNGKRIAYTTNYSGHPDDEHLVDIYVRDLKPNVTPAKLVRRNGSKYNLKWSPDGTHLAFVSSLEPDTAFSREALFVAEVPSVLEQGREATAEAEGIAIAIPIPQPDSDIKGYEWQADTQNIYALIATSVDTRLYRLAKEREPEPLDAGGEGDRTSLAVSPNGEVLAWVHDSHTSLSEVERWEKGKPLQTLTHIHDDFTKTYRIPRHEVICWNSSDGLEIEGVLIYPLDYQKGERYPLIVQVHGGPKGRVVRALRSYYHCPVWASEGYALLLPNFRGSEGYGNAFAVANYQDIGGGDFDDIMAGVDYCIALGVADAERLGIMGGSYGGFMTNWAIGHTDRFRAAISMFGIFNLHTDYANSDFPRWDHSYLGGWYWEVPEMYHRLSPGTYVQNIKTPTLIVHGDDDNNTFISNSKEMYQALRHRGVTVQFVHYPREGHGVREPNHKMDEIRRSLAWMDRYLKAGGALPKQYRLRDAVPNADGTLELSVLTCESETYLGVPAEDKESATTLWEVAFTLHRKESDRSLPTQSFCLSDIRLVSQEQPDQSVTPIGVPVKVSGGRVLVEGENLRLNVSPNAKTGEWGFGCVVVVRLPKQGGEYLLHIAHFPPVALIIGGKEAEEKADVE